jgi:uncharacterized membrane protein
MLPKIPDWDALHPLVIHFPIVLFLVAPLFVVLGMVLSKNAKAFATSGLILMLLGTVSAFVAVSTGKAAGELADHTPQILAVLERHEEAGEQTRLIFTVLTSTYLVLLTLPGLHKRDFRRGLVVTIHGVFLVIYLAGVLRLVQTANLGGTLVHGLGVHALMPEVAPAPLPR